jgi:hypothetical protein
MTTFSGSPKVLKGGIVLLHPRKRSVIRTIALQYNPESLARSLQIQAFGGDGRQDRSEALRIKAPPVETIKLEAEIDATDQMERGDKAVGERGIYPQLAALEIIAYPTIDQLYATNSSAQRGTLEVAPMEAPLTLFVWSKSRVVPVRITELSVTEEAFDPNLNPIRAKVSLGMRVLSVNDLGFDHPGGKFYLLYQKDKEQQAAATPSVALSVLGLTGGLPQ